MKPTIGHLPKTPPKSLAYFDPKQALKAQKFIEKICTHPKGRLKGQPLILEKWQLNNIVYPLFGWRRKDDGNRLFKKLIFSVARKNGKLLGMKTPILTANRGWATVETLKLGDQVFSVDGQPSTVISLTQPETRPCYCVTFANGESIVAADTHDWTVVSRVGLSSKKGSAATAENKETEIDFPWWADYCTDGKQKVRKLTTEQLASKVTYGSRNDRNFYVVMPDPLQFPAQNLPIDPYVLGYWLGNGNHAHHKSQISAHLDDAEEIREYFVKAGFDCSSVRNPKGETAAFTAYKLNRDVNFEDIPECYFLGSVSQREALIQGLLDSDGHISKRTSSGCQVEFSSSREWLANQFGELLASFGVKYTIIKRQDRISGRWLDSYSYRVVFNADASVAAFFRLQRKAGRLKGRSHRRSRVNAIVSVEPCETEVTRCIGIDHPSHTFLCGKTHIPTHNTVLAVTILLYSFLIEQAGTTAEGYFASTDRENAGVALDMAKSIIEPSELLRDELQIMQFKIRSRQDQQSVIKSLSRQPKHGSSPSVVLMDELHQWVPDRGLLLAEALETGMAERENPLTIYTSTVGHGRNGSFFDAEFSYAEQLISGEMTDWNILPVIYAAPDNADYRKKRTWKHGNPNLGVSVSKRFLEEQLVKAENKGDSTSFKIFHLNQWAAPSDAWIDLVHWDSLRGNIETDGLRCWGGLDLSSVSDLTCFSLIWEPDDNGKIMVKHWYWLPERALKVAKFAHLYQQWFRDGWLRILPGDVIDQNYVMEQITEILKGQQIQQIGIDRWQANYLIPLFGTKDIDLVGLPQGFSTYSSAMKDSQRELLKRTIVHEGNPVTRWNLSNLRVIRDQNGNTKPDRTNTDHKIDGLVAFFMEFWLLNGEVVLNNEIFGESEVLI